MLPLLAGLARQTGRLTATGAPSVTATIKAVGASSTSGGKWGSFVRQPRARAQRTKSAPGGDEFSSSACLLDLRDPQSENAIFLTRQSSSSS